MRATDVCQGRGCKPYSEVRFPARSVALLRVGSSFEFIPDSPAEDVPESDVAIGPQRGLQAWLAGSCCAQTIWVMVRCRKLGHAVTAVPAQHGTASGDPGQNASSNRKGALRCSNMVDNLKTQQI